MAIDTEAAPEVRITRFFAAPREAVFAAWTDPERLSRWFAPPGCTIFYRSLDVRPGGAFHSCIRTPDGRDCWCRGVYAAVDRPERIVYTVEMSNAAGEAVESGDAGKDADWPRETTVTVTFAERDGGTLLTLQQNVSEAVAKRTGAHPSWLGMLDRLAEELEATGPRNPQESA